MARKARPLWAASHCLLTGYCVTAVVTAVAVAGGTTRRPRNAGAGARASQWRSAA